MPSEKPRRQELSFEWENNKRVLTVDDSPVTVGRLKRCDITIVSPLVSREHLRLFWNGVKWQVTDTSVNGAFNGSKLPREWELDECTTVQLGGEKGPRLSITFAADDLGETNPSALSSEADGRGEGLIFDNGEAILVESSDDSKDSADDSILAQSTSTQPVVGAPTMSSTFTKPIYAEAKKGANGSELADSKSIAESDIATGEHAATVIGFENRDLGNSLASADNENEIDFSEPSVTGQVDVPDVDPSLEPQITGQVNLQNADSTVSKIQAAGVIIGSAAMAFAIWALIALLV